MMLSFFGGKISLTPLRAVLCAVWLFCMMIFLAPLVRNINIGSLAGGAVFIFLFIVTLFAERFSEIISSLKACIGGRIFLVSVCTVIVLSAVTAAIISVFMILRMNAPPSESVPVIVAGCRVNGSVPSLMLKKRINTAYDYLSENPDSICIASGGQGSDENISEAFCIKRELCAMGISEDRIYCEDRSTSTRENMRFSGELLDELGYKRKAVIVTSEYHEFRAGIIAEKQGFEVYSISAPTTWYLLPVCWVREWFGVIYEFLI